MNNVWHENQQLQQWCKGLLCLIIQCQKHKSKQSQTQDCIYKQFCCPYLSVSMMATVAIFSGSTKHRNSHQLMNSYFSNRTANAFRNMYQRRQTYKYIPLCLQALVLHKRVCTPSPLSPNSDSGKSRRQRKTEKNNRKTTALSTTSLLLIAQDCWLNKNRKTAAKCYGKRICRYVQRAQRPQSKEKMMARVDGGGGRRALLVR